MRVLGLDTSTTSTGWCVMENGKVLAYGAIKPPKELDSIDRIIYIESYVKELIKAKKVEYVAIEELVSFRNAKITRVLQGLISHLEIELRKRDILTILVKPSEWRSGKIKGRKREELKRACIEYARDVYGIEVGDDEADAILIARYADELEKEV